MLTDRELIEKLGDALQHAVDFLSLEAIILAREPAFLKTWEALIAKARAALAAPVVPIEKWQALADAGKHADNRTFANAHRSDLHLIAAKKAEQAWRSRPTWPSDFCRTGA